MNSRPSPKPYIMGIHAYVPGKSSGSDGRPLTQLSANENPLGSSLAALEQLEQPHAGLPDDVLFVLDEAYGEYLAPEYQQVGFDLAAAHENVLVTRTFSKIYGLAAERIGWATGAPHLIDALNRIRGPFNVTTSGQRAALAAVGDQDFVTSSREHNTAERGKFVDVIESLGNHGLRATPSEANFVLVNFEGDVSAKAALDALAKAGYAVRHLPSQGLPDALRITIGKSEDMERVASCLRTLCGEAP